MRRIRTPKALSARNMGGQKVRRYARTYHCRTDAGLAGTGEGFRLLLSSSGGVAHYRFGGMGDCLAAEDAGAQYSACHKVLQAVAECWCYAIAEPSGVAFFDRVVQPLHFLGGLDRLCSAGCKRS